MRWPKRNCRNCSRSFIPTNGRSFYCSSVCSVFSRTVASADPDECWGWLGSLKSGRGYPVIRRHGRDRKASHVVYEKLNGRIPTGLLVLHSCDNPECLNPRHLSLGTFSDNAKDRERRGRSRTSKLVPFQVRVIRRLHAFGGWSRLELAELFGVRRHAIGNILRRKTWDWI